MERRNFLQLGAYSAFALTATSNAVFADWSPKRPINIIVPYSAGGGTDTFARAFASVSDKVFPVPLVITNKPGSAGITGSTEVARSRPDGTTLLFASAGSLLLTSMLHDAEINPIDSFRILGQIGSQTTSLVVPVDSRFKSLKELVDFGKSHPGELRWGHAGRGTQHYVAGQTFLDSNDIKAVDVPFKGGGDARAAVMGKQVDFIFTGIQQVAGFSDEIKALAITSSHRDRFQPDVPTFEELGYNWVDVISPYVIFAPKDTPDDIVKYLSKVIKEVTELPELATDIAKYGNYPVYRNGEEVKALLSKMKSQVKPTIEALKS